MGIFSFLASMDYDLKALQFSIYADTNSDSKSVDHNAKSNKKGKDGSTYCCVISQSRSASPEIFLPKEWTY